jgi:hypothetical protein
VFSTTCLLCCVLSASSAYERGLAALEHEEYKDAIEFHAIKLDPKDADAYMKRGDAFCFQNNIKDCANDYFKAADIVAEDITMAILLEHEYGKMLKIHFMQYGKLRAFLFKYLKRLALVNSIQTSK